MSRLLLTVLLLAVAVSSVAQAPANDECINAIPITVSATSACTNSVYATSENATQSMAPCAGSTAEDVWFSFVATEESLVMVLSPQGILLSVVEVFSGSCGSLVSMGCYSANVNDLEFSKPLTGLTVGNTYYIRVYANYPDGRAFSLCIIPQGANDECAGAINIPVSTGYDWNYITANNNYNSSTGAICSMTKNLADGWFRFTALDTVHLIHMTSTSSNNLNFATRFQIFEGSCGALVPISAYREDGLRLDCVGGAFAQDYLTIRGLTAGNTYYIQVQQDMIRINNPSNLSIAVASVPANDGITGAQNIPINPGTTCVSTTSGNFRNASPTPGITHNCSGINGADLWYTFTAAASRHLISVHYQVAPSNSAFQLYYMDNGTLVPVACSNGASENHFGDFTTLTPGTVYYMRVKGGQAVVDRLIDICITTPGVTASNDDCASPVTIPLNQQILGSIRGSTFTNGLNGCATGGFPRDVWYTFTPANNTSAVLEMVLPAGDDNYGIDVLTGSCGTMTRIACANVTSYITDLHFTANAGVAHYVRVFESGASSDNRPFMLSFTQFVPLPVTITAFKATYTANNTVKLTWNTEEESHINYYDVERSSNGIQFNQVTRVSARNISAPSEYVAEDLSPVTGISYYRLKIVDQDGKVEYSKTVKMDTDGSFTGNLKVSRQGNFILIHNNNPDFKNVTLNIFTVTGQKIFSASKRLTGGVNPIAIPGKVNQPLFIQLVTEDNVTRTFKVY